MNPPRGKPAIDAEVLLEVIRVQTEIARLGLDLGGVMDIVAQRLPAVTGASGAIIELAEGDEMVYRAASGMAEKLLGLRLRRQGSLSGLCVETKTLLRCTDSETDGRVDREACRKVGLRSMVVVPLTHAETSVGVVKIASPRPDAFSDQDVEVLELMSGLIAATMFHSARYEANELYHRATHDSLTGLANRSLFYDRLRQSLALARRQSALVGILNLDMDGLKSINDRLGHRAGDAAIKETAERISRASRQSDTVARLGGDEFGIVLTQVQSRESAARHALRLAGDIGQPFRFEEHPMDLAASIGLAVFPEDGVEIELLVEKADRSMYNVKRTRKGR